MSGGSLTVDGAYARTVALYGPSRILEFRATFSAATFQNAGLAFDLNNVSRWAVFGIGNTADQLYARVQGSTAESIGLGAALLGSPHTYRIEWAADAIRFYVDGTLRHTSAIAITDQMRPIASDFGAGGGALAVDWMRMSPYPAAGSFTSRVFDAGSTVGWQQLTADELHPANTSSRLRGAQRQRGGARCQLEQLRAGHWRRLQPDRPLPAVPRHPADHRQRAEPDPAQRDRQLRRGTSEPGAGLQHQDVPDQTNAEGDVSHRPGCRRHRCRTTTPLTYAASGLPAGLSIDPATGLISGTISPQRRQWQPLRGRPSPSATAWRSTASDTFTWTVSNTNQAPAFSTDLPTRTDAEGDVILSSDGLDADATDADGDTLTYSATGLPDGISIEPRHRRHQRHPQLRQRRQPHRDWSPSATAPTPTPTASPGR